MMGFLPRSWAYIRDMYSRRSGRALQKACELLCWWRLSDRVSRRRTPALELDAELDKHADAEVEPDEHELVFLRSEHLCQLPGSSVPALCTRKVAGLAPGEIESGWTKHAHCAMPPAMRTCNVRAMLKEPLTQKELVHRDRRVPLKLDLTTLIPAEMKLRSWLTRVRDPAT